MRIVYKDCRFCKGTGEIIGRKCKVCKGEGHIPVKVSEKEAYNEAFKESEVYKRNEAFSMVVEKLKKKYGNIYDIELFMLKDAFDCGISYMEQKKNEQQ